MNYILPENVREGLLSYLGRRPYNEVFSGMKALLDLQPLDAPAEEAKSDEAPGDPEPNTE